MGSPVSATTDPRSALGVPSAMRWWRGTVWFVKGVLGESAYEGYLAHHTRSGSPDEPMTEKQYWRARTDHQERSPQSRCC